MIPAGKQSTKIKLEYASKRIKILFKVYIFMQTFAFCIKVNI